MPLQATQNPGDQLYIITNFSAQGPDRIATPLVLANCALAVDSDVVIWLTMDGVELAREGSADTVPGNSFSPLSELLDSFIETAVASEYALPAGNRMTCKSRI
jgi:predicted peroxiredoxin